MKNLNYNLLDFSEEIIRLYTLVDKLSAENDELRYYKDEYRKLLSSSIEHNNTMAGNMLSFLLSENYTLNTGTKK